MSRIVFLIESIASGLYILCAVGLLFSSWRVMQARQELRYAEFELARELARKKQAQAITLTVGLIELILAVYAVSTIVAPTVRGDLIALNTGGPVNVPTNAPFRTSTPGGSGAVIPGNSGAGSIEQLMASVTAAAMANDGGVQLLATPTVSPTFVGTINPDVGAIKGCDTPNAQLEVPANGQVIFDSIEVRGVANTPNFALYKFELSGPSTGNAFTPYGGDKTSPVLQNGVLGQLALSAFQPGLYQFRLVVFDNTNALRASCMVTVEVRERPPTATLPGGSK
ncbi:MAG: hypothetical protein ABI947_08025 [Chloroflexota bacterium]